MDNLSYSPDLQHFLDLKRCADTNDTNAMLRLAKVYLNVNGENTNKKAFCLLKQLANATYTAAQTDAQYMLASCYENGKGITKNYKQAAKWYRQAYINANNDIYSAYEDKFHVLLSKPDEEIEPEVIDCVTESAENQGDPQAAFSLGWLYQTQKQFKIAANHYKNAARLNILRRNQLTTRNASGEFIAKEH